MTQQPLWQDRLACAITGGDPFGIEPVVLMWTEHRHEWAYDITWDTLRCKRCGIVHEGAQLMRLSPRQ